jgi:hypothetical protein
METAQVAPDSSLALALRSCRHSPHCPQRLPDPPAIVLLPLLHQPLCSHQRGWMKSRRCPRWMAQTDSSTHRLCCCCCYHPGMQHRQRAQKEMLTVAWMVAFLRLQKYVCHVSVSSKTHFLCRITLVICLSVNYHHHHHHTHHHHTHHHHTATHRCHRQYNLRAARRYVTASQKVWQMRQVWLQPCKVSYLANTHTHTHTHTHVGRLCAPHRRQSGWSGCFTM